MAVNKWEISDEVYLNGDRVPGRVTVSVHVGRAVKKTKTPGDDIPHLADEGYDGAAVNMVVECFKEEHWDQMIAIVRKLDISSPGALQEPIQLISAEALEHKIENVYCESIDEGPRRDGFKVYTLSLPQWFPPEAKKKTNQSKNPAGEPGDIGGFDVPPPDPNNVGPDFP